jgi:cell division protein ZapA (FtsZ GTPase activity inhibitor)
MSSDDAPKAGAAGNHPVTITVNNQPVTVMGPRTTGRAIKQAAIDAGQRIELSFTLSQLQPNGRYKNIGDDQPVTVNRQSVFTATDDDDDS